MPWEDDRTAPFQGRSASPSPLPADPSGRYEFLNEIARGGMGVVYRVRDTALGRDVALKMMRGWGSGEEIDRFIREAKSVAQLNHPRVVQVLDFGRLQGNPYFTMALAEGGSLAQSLPRFRNDLRAGVAVLEEVARAVQCVHERGLVHRDLKPGNILLDQQGRPLVSDFGLAKGLDDGLDLTSPEDRLGTPAYMAPEQASGRHESVGPATDVWALGVVLFELVCGRRPFDGATRADVMSAVLSQDPTRPRALSSSADRALETIILKCLEKDPRGRYGSAGALADDLGCWLRGEPTRARPLGPAGRVARVVRRHPLRVATAAAVMAAAVTAALAWRHLDPDRPLQEARAELAAGRPVTLVGPTGPPRWSNWQTPGAVAADRPDVPFRIQSNAVTLLELLPDVSLTSYRLRAEVRHEYGTAGEVGLYLCHSKQPGGLGDVHSCLYLCFADWGARAGQLRAELLHYSAPPGAEGFQFNSRAHIGKKFTPLGPVGRPDWRALTIDVTADAIHVYWGDPPEPAGELRAQKREQLSRALLVGRPQLAGVAAQFAHNGGLGLYVANSSASFRNVAVNPLDQP